MRVLVKGTWDDIAEHSELWTCACWGWFAEAIGFVVAVVAVAEIVVVVVGRACPGLDQ